MKLNFLYKSLICIVLALTVSALCSSAVLAIDLDGDGIDDEPVATEQVTQAYTEAPVYTEAYTEVQTEYIEPTTAYQAPTTVYTQPATEPYEAQTEYRPQTEATQAQTAAAAQVEQPTEPTQTEFVAPTLPKTVSDKEYSTSYTAGIVSWICVAAGVIVAAVVMISTKAGGRRRV